ncbi:MAG: sigma-70 family RNA polymerase sigma factor [Oscillospiraceae bacterium]|nr:sigma-70 family RNA polymerase sigma factor [Oscillospiraceae bacterium]
MSLDLTASVQKAQAGDTQAFAELYSLVYKDLYRIALMNLNNEHDASDAVSDAVLEAYTNIRKLRDANAFKAWMMTILTAKIKNKQKEYIRNRDLREDIEDLEDVQPDETTDIKFDGVLLTNAMAELSADERMVLSLNIVSGYTSEEIAGMTGISANTVRSKAARAKEKLKKLLE